MLVADHVAGRGVDLFREVCARDLEGVVGTWAPSPYRLLDGRSPGVKVRNASYTELDARFDLFALRGGW